jgi:hypothetical protein
VIAVRNPDSMVEDEQISLEQGEEIYARCFQFEHRNNEGELQGHEIEKQEFLAFKQCLNELQDAQDLQFKKNNKGGRFHKISQKDNTALYSHTSISFFP